MMAAMIGGAKLQTTLDYFQVLLESVFHSYRIGEVAAIVINGVCANSLMSER
jgi:hypothetical protein